MGDLTVEPEGLRAYGDATGAIASEIGAAGAFDLAAHIAALTPVFGAIGADFLAVFGVTQADHAQAVAQLAGHFASTSATAHASAASYEGADIANSGALGAVATGMEA